MLSVSIKHPDSEAFIDAKMEEGKVTGANVSVKLDDDFMKAAVSDKPYMQQWPIYAEKPKFTKEISTRKLWEKI
jgi:ribonucleoside-diphosphate reductase alpha chain